MALAHLLFPRRFRSGFVGLGVGLQLNGNASTASVSPGVNATAYARHFGIDEYSWRNYRIHGFSAMDNADIHSGGDSNYGDHSTRWMGLAEAQGTYNAAGYNPQTDRYTTSFSLRLNLFAGGQNIQARRACGLYGGAHAIGQVAGALNLTGASHVEVRVGPETGLICKDDVSGLVFLISPSVGYYGARRYRGDDTGRTLNSEGISGGAVARLSLAERVFLQAAGYGTIHRTGGDHDHRALQFTAGMSVGGDWQMLGFINIDQYYHASANAEVNQDFWTVDATLNLINEF